ncbi:MAG: hypothetical protein ACFFCQ_00100 [Promethearchaeota archaeon]
MSAEKVRKFMKMVMTQLKNDEGMQEFVKEWVYPYDGKIFQVEADGEYFYSVLTKDAKMTLHEGQYPSPDVIYRSTGEILLGIFTGKIRFWDPIKSWDLMVIGAAHESVPLSELILQALMKM